jgi:hypothetical protein
VQLFFFLHNREEFWSGFTFLLKKLDREVLERRFLAKSPNFVDIVLNHVIEDSGIFWHSAKCLRIFIEALGTSRCCNDEAIPTLTH